MGYRDPKVLLQDNSAMLKSISSLQDGFTKTAESFAQRNIASYKAAQGILAKQAKKNAAASKGKDKLEQTFQDGYTDAKGQATELFNSIQTGSDVDTRGFIGQIDDVFTVIGEQLRLDMDALGSNASISDLNKLQNDAIAEVTKLKTDVTQLTAAYKEYQELKKIHPGSEGAIVPGMGDDMIQLFEYWDMGGKNTKLTWNQDIGVGGMYITSPLAGEGRSSNDGVVLDVTDWSTTAQKDGKFFNTIPSTDVSEAVQEIQKNIQAIDSAPDAKEVDAKYLHAYLDTDEGKEIINSYVDYDNLQGQWASFGTISDKGINSNGVANFDATSVEQSIRDLIINEVELSFEDAREFKNGKLIDTQ